MLVEPRRERGQVVEHHVGAGRLELLTGAAAGQHGHAGHPRGEGSLDVVDVVADVDVGGLGAEHLGLARSPDPALHVVDVEAEVLDVELRVGRVLPGDEQDPALVAAYGGQGLVRPGEGGHGVHGVVGVERAEAVTGRGDGILGEVVAQQVLERRAEAGGHLLGRERDAELVAEHGQRGREPRLGVDQRHVEIEADDELVHACSVGGFPRTD